MMKHRWRQLAKSFGSHVNPEKAEELKRAKIEIESNLTRILKFIKNEDRSKRGGITKESRNQSELVGLVEDFHKQYQSLYALYDHLTGEFGKVERESSPLYSSSSDSEYYSSEEIDSNFGKLEEHQKSAETTREVLETENKGVTDLNHKLVSSREGKEGLNFNGTGCMAALYKAEAINKNLKMKADNREKEHPPLVNVHEFHGTQASAQIKELEKQLTCLKTELESLHSQKRDIEIQFESKATKAKQLSGKNVRLDARVMELEQLLNKKGDEVSGLQDKIKDNENYATSKSKVLMEQANNMELEAKALQSWNGEMEENKACKRNKTLIQKNGLMDQLSIMQHDLDSLHTQKTESDEQMERKTEELHQSMIEIETLKDKIAENTETEHRMLEEKEGFLGKIKDMELEVVSLRNQKNELAEQLRGKLCKTNKLGEENRVLHARNTKLERALTEREEELSVLQREYEAGKNGTCTQVMTLTAGIDDLRLEIDSLAEQKSKLELENETERKEYSQSLTTMENENIRLSDKIADQQRILKEQEGTINRISGEYKQEKSWLKKSKYNLHVSERKMEELVEAFRMKLEDKIRLLSQRVRVAEQLHTENKDSYRLTMDKYEEKNRILEEKIATYEDELMKMRDILETKFDVVNGLDLAARNLEDHKVNFVKRISKMLIEIQYAKDWIKGKNMEVKQLKHNVDCLTAVLDHKKEKESLLKEKVWKLEAKLSKEGGEKLNLMKTVSQLEKKVRKLEKNVKEKEEELSSLGEKKMEAIRQLCFLIDYHRSRSDNFKDLISKMSLSSRTIT